MIKINASVRLLAATSPVVTPLSKPDYGDQESIVKLVKKATGLKIYFDYTDMVDEKSSDTILSNAFKKKTIQHLIDAAQKYKDGRKPPSA